MEEGTFIGWLKNNGDLVQAGEPLFTLEGEKATQDIEATEGGILQLSDDGPKPGDTVKVGAVLALLLEEGASDARHKRTPQSAPQESPSTSIDPTHPEAPARPPVPVLELELALDAPQPPVATVIATASVRISPRAARRAIAMGVPWQDLRGTGRTGRIRERDVLAAAPKATSGVAATPNTSRNKPASATSGLQPQLSGRLIPFSPTRRAIARRLSEATHSAVPVTLTAQVDATQLARLRVQLKAAALGTGHPAPTFQDILVKLATQALREHRLLNAQWREEGLFIPDPINIAIAVDTEEGLLVPVLRDVAQMTLEQIAASSRRLIELARARRLQPGDLEGGTFTITNLGGLGIDAFTPVINPPQCAILGLGRVQRQAVVTGDGIVARERMILSLTFDHRSVDGAPAARFLGTLSRLMDIA